jgi:hypothetical protein
MHFTRCGAAGDVNRLCLLDLDRLDMMQLGRRRRFRNVNSAAAQNGTAERAGRQFRQGHPNRHDQCSLCFAKTL